MSDALSRLALKFGTDKFGDHDYMKRYEFHLQHFRDREFKLLEIGVGGYENPNDGGNSLRMWSAYFQFANIWAIDINDKSGVNVERVKIFRGSQEDPQFLFKLNAAAGGFDVVIGDGSHRCAHVINTFKLLFPLLNRHGVYAIEDTQASYWKPYGGSSQDMDSLETTMGYFKSLVHGLNHAEINSSHVTSEYFAKNIDSICFYHNIIFIHKDENTFPSNIPVGHVARGD